MVPLHGHVGYDKTNATDSIFRGVVKTSDGTCPLEPRDIPAFFEHVEKFFRNYHVDGEIQANLLIMSLNEKAKTWLHTISADGLKDYSEIKTHSAGVQVKPDKIER
ncbi:hypothetical protein HELRODRAFT_181174 [Helobdella robusta]|uniref:DUF4939 domain-containing protein n=1 Tax=Helobdella robusta TaxID=6412 RepID=T1FGP9_HELRO|nr:hypothetical protein HELRODRAFT_181174 [Helobdella robusta]ESN93238.1 hypothetical protein HELRODRAFT_181174 [Helobdella robusta]